MTQFPKGTDLGAQVQHLELRVKYLLRLVYRVQMEKADLENTISRLEEEVTSMYKRKASNLLMEEVVASLCALLAYADPNHDNPELHAAREEMEKAKQGFERWGGAYSYP